MTQEDYQVFCALYSQAERYIKRLERCDPDRGLLIPAINELRYAGCHIKRSFCAESREEYHLHITSAERHCKRSICDTLSSLIDFVNISLRDIRDDYRFVPIGSHVDGHTHLMAEVGEIIQFVDEHAHDEDREAIECREDHVHDDVDDWPYEDLVSKADRLTEIKKLYDAARPDLNRASRRFFMTVIVAAISVPVAIAFLTALVAIGIAVFGDDAEKKPVDKSPGTSVISAPASTRK